MSTRVGPALGLRIAASAAAYPCDLEGERGEELDNAAVYARVLGPGWRAELARRGWSPEHPERRLGVRLRQWVRGADSGDLAELAARRALAVAALPPEELGALLVATSTPARATSSLAHRVARSLGLRCAAFDVRAGGAGGLHAWVLACGLLALEERPALVVAAETPSRWLAPGDAASALLYGDGAGALLLARDPGSSGGLQGALLGSEALPGRPFTVPGALPPTAAELEAGAYAWQAPDAAYSSALLDLWRAVPARLAASFPETAREAAHLVPYAVHREQLAAATESFGSARARLFDELATRGALGCASPLAAVHALRGRGSLRRGEVVASVAIGGGVAWAGLLWRHGA